MSQVLQVKAVDGDRSINSDIEYAITGGPQHIFGINKSTGTVYSKVRGGGSVWSGLSLSTLQAIIDRESELAVYGTFIMEISATEVDTTGTRGQSVLTEVTIIVTVSNKYLNIKAWHNYLPNGCLTQDTPTPPGSQ